MLINGNGVDLPAPITINVGDELLWSSSTGRSLTGRMLGRVIAEKKTFDITWGVLSEDELAVIRSGLPSGFFTFKIRDNDANCTIEAYRGTITKDAIGTLGDGIYYYRTVSASVIQR